MNPEVKALWLEDLRSGKHKQAKRILNGDAGFCCLGRLTDIYRQSPANTCNLQWAEDLHGYEDGRKVFGNSTGVLIHAVIKWAGLSHSTGDAVVVGGENRSLTELNDAGYSFAQIADIIEAQL